MKASLRCIVVFLTLGLFAATLAPAADLVLKGATAWKKDYVFNDGYWEFTRQVEKLSGGKIKVDWKGGPEIAPAFEMLSLVQRGVVDVLGSSAAYYTDKYMEGVFPEYFIGTPAVMRNAGITKFFDDLSQKKTAVKLLGMTSGPVGIAIFTKKPVKGIADFKGLKMRSTPTYLPMGQALGASMIRIPWADLYPALERGVVEGYFSPAIGTLQTKLYEQVCCMVAPHFWTVRTWLYIGMKTWNKLTPEQQKDPDGRHRRDRGMGAGSLRGDHRHGNRYAGEGARYEGHRVQGGRGRALPQDGVRVGLEQIRPGLA